MNIQPAPSISGTSFRCYLIASHDEVAAVLGPSEPWGDKCAHQWAISVEGVVLTIYDYKWVAPEDDTPVQWHVGGKVGRGVIELILREIFPGKQVDDRIRIMNLLAQLEES